MYPSSPSMPDTPPLSAEDRPPLTEQRFHDIAGMLSIISPWPWEWDGETSGSDAYFVHSAEGEPICQVFGNGWDTKRDQEYGESDHTFIKNAPGYVWELLAEVSRLRTENEALAAARDKTCLLFLEAKLEAARRPSTEDVAAADVVAQFKKLLALPSVAHSDLVAAAIDLGIHPESL